jgi:antitoxin MazE
MQAKIQKWGNSLALRIPKAFADEAGLESDSAVEICIVDGRIHIIPTRELSYELDTLLNAITAKNRHKEIDIGDARGNEIVS